MIQRALDRDAARGTNLLRLVLASLAVASTSLTSPAFAQRESPPSTAEETVPTFKSGVELVRLDVRVMDGSGQPIGDLRADEIEIYDDGQRLPVVLFQPVRESASYVDEVIRATTAEVSSNVAFPRGHLYVLIFDQQHITPGNEHRARLAAEQFIRRRVRPSDRVALFAIPGPGPQIPFTADRTRVLEEMGSIRGSYQRVVSSPLGTMSVYEAHRITQRDDRLMAEIVERIARESGADFRPEGRDDDAITRRLLQENARTIVNQTDAESRQFLQRLSDVIATFRDIEGRKTVVLFSEGFFQDNLARELESVAAAAAQSYCVFYTFDLNQRGTPIAEAFVSETTLATEVHARIAPLSTLAVETDGTMVVDASARAGEVLDTIAAQTQEYYLVGFAPPEEARLNRGKYRRVNIKVRRPGARVSARSGYAVAPEPASTDRRRSIDRVLAAPFVQQGLAVDYTTYVLKGAAQGRHQVVLSLETQLPVRSAPGDAADVVFVLRDVRRGHVAASGTDTIPLPVAASEGVALGQGTWRVQFGVPPGSYLMRVVVREPGGLTGSADRRLDVRAFDGPDITVSDLVIGSGRAALPVRPLAYAVDGLTGLVEIYGRSASQLESLDVTVELRPSADEAPLNTVTAELTRSEPDESGLRRRAHLAMPLVDVPPGRYVVRATVRGDGEVIGERTRQIEVLPGTAPVELTAAPIPQDQWTALELVRGYLAQQYVEWLGAQAGTPELKEAIGLARAQRWEQVELRIRRQPADDGIASAVLGLALFAREDFHGAVTALERARAAMPDDALTAFFAGWAHEGAGDPRAALGAWRSAAHLDPTLVSAHLALAEGYLRLAQPALATQAIKAGLAKMPSSPELLAKLQQIEHRQP